MSIKSKNTQVLKRGIKNKREFKIIIWGSSNRVNSLFGAFVGIITLIVTLAYPQVAHASELGDNFDLVKTIKNVSIDLSKSNQNNGPDVSINHDYLKKPLITETKITVDPPVRKIQKPIVKQSLAKTTSSPVLKKVEIENAVAHHFPYGYCTYYVASKRFIPWSGNAITWLSGAKMFGFATGQTPSAGAIMVTREGGRTGHVAFVNTVNNDGTITVSEMNYAGWGRISSRTISPSIAIGFIY